jgi:rifampicin phosphotransferase
MFPLLLEDTLRSWSFTTGSCPLGIPSPDLVVSLFASAAQVIGLGCALLFGYRHKQLSSPTGDSKPVKGSRRGGAALWIGLWALTSVAFLLYFLDVQDARRTRLRANLTRASVEAGQGVGDSSLRTLSFSGQLEHAAGMSSVELDRLMAAGSKLNLIDVRERGEVAQGSIPGSWARRYPDLQLDDTGLSVEGATTVLLCFSGNRSSELCDYFNARGQSCCFMVGGYEKWIAEGRELDLAEARSPGALRQLPPFAGSDELLDTTAVQHLLSSDGAVLVDVRYPEDFAHGHLPGAINLPIRMLTTTQLDELLADLPPGPVIAPCYDKRSSFYALILGLELDRIGREFLGRYTLPHEFSGQKQLRSHVAAWEAEHKGATPFSWVGEQLAAMLSFFASRWGLALAILFMVLASRTLLLPWSWKAERDRVLGKRLAPELRALTQRHVGDPGLALRERRALEKQARLTPLRNLGASIGQIVLLLLLFAAVGGVARESSGAFLWTSAAGEPEAPALLSGVVTLLTVALGVRSVAASRKYLRVAVGLACGALLFWLTWRLPVAQNFYLSLSLAWVLVQGALADRRYQLPAASSPGASESLAAEAYVAPLHSVHGSEFVGGKARRLAELMRAGFPVPDGFVIRDLRATPGARVQLPLRLQPEVQRAFLQLASPRVAVRSSAANEDGSEFSQAGVYDTQLNVDEGRLWAAAEEICASLAIGLDDTGSGDAEHLGAVVVQSMVPAEYAGVLFTRHPQSSGEMLVELIAGLGEQLVGGEMTPLSFSFNRYTGRRLQEDEPPIDLQPLQALARRIEELFQRPQDIEWAYHDGRFAILQSRDITAGAEDAGSLRALREEERARLLARHAGKVVDEPLFVQNDISELLPEPTPFSLSWMQELWSAGGTVDRACRSLGIAYPVLSESPEVVTSAFGRLVVDKVEERRRSSAGLSAIAGFRLARNARAYEAEWTEVYLPGFQQRMAWWEAIAEEQLDRAATLDMLAQLRRSFMHSTYVHAERINMAAELYSTRARQRLERAGLEPGLYLCAFPITLFQGAQLALGAAEGDEGRASFLKVAGHRAPLDFEFAQERYSEDPAAVEVLELRPGSEAALKSSPPPPGIGRMARVELDRALRFQTLKEDAKHESMRELALVRRVLLRLGDCVGLGEDMFMLRVAEVLAIPSGEDAALPPELLKLIESRRAEQEAFAEVLLPTVLDLAKLERLPLGEGPLLTPLAGPGRDRVLQGQRVSGAGVVTGRVRRLLHPSEGVQLQDGEVLVTRFTDPTWTPLFARAGALVTEVGGWLSHAAIQAREMGLATVVGATEALEMLRDGDLVQLMPDGCVQRIDDRRCEERVAGDAPLELHVDGKAYAAILIDSSASGLRVRTELQMEPLSPLILSGIEGHPVDASVVRSPRPGELALQFDTPMGVVAPSQIPSR